MDVHSVVKECQKETNAPKCLIIRWLKLDPQKSQFLKKSNDDNQTELSSLDHSTTSICTIEEVEEKNFSSEDSKSLIEHADASKQEALLSQEALESNVESQVNFIKERIKMTRGIVLQSLDSKIKIMSQTRKSKFYNHSRNIRQREPDFGVCVSPELEETDTQPKQRYSVQSGNLPGTLATSFTPRIESKKATTDIMRSFRPNLRYKSSHHFDLFTDSNNQGETKPLRRNNSIKPLLRRSIAKPMKIAETSRQIDAVTPKADPIKIQTKKNKLSEVSHIGCLTMRKVNRQNDFLSRIQAEKNENELVLPPIYNSRLVSHYDNQTTYSN
eukprot:CAMPEP_0168334030 /NCGR_PEP_ID=MMETSP0213-20121227/9989_1 /TAXON_ID=151035 /ORGANISM="Euplotes harpa, Strain FSP1.4" /LENGTH=327 /DNA_ID=CAMNT_0008338525 /DNA_START=297 /DNA_END=1280 /DNA_ORIENTATION=+